MNLWCVYNKPKDYPDKVVARRWVLSASGEPEATDDLVIENRLESVRRKLLEKNLFPLPRHDNDDACIVESWI